MNAREHYEAMAREAAASEGHARLTGEGQIKLKIHEYRRRECDNCGEPATKRLTFCYVNGRSNPASSMYGRDDCTYCSDAQAFSCDACERDVRRACCPSGMDWGSTFSAGGRFDHMLLYRVERDASAEEAMAYATSLSRAGGAA